MIDDMKTTSWDPSDAMHNPSQPLVSLIQKLSHLSSRYTQDPTEVLIEGRELIQVVVQVPRYHIWGAKAQNRFEAASKQSNDPPLLRVNTLGSGEDNMKLKE
ncbi:hypothetical protein Tco_1335952 [Tanacetum coccineum]